MITIRKGAKLDAEQKKVIAAIEPFTTGLDLEVTRGHDTPAGQLATIAKYAKQNKISFPEFIPDGPFDVKKEVPGVGLVYHWQRTWEALLLLDIVVNPPLYTICTVDYVRPTGENMRGKGIKASSHIIGENGKWPLDFSVKVNGTANIKLVASILTRAKKAGAKISYIKQEPKNGCVHAGTC